MTQDRTPVVAFHRLIPGIPAPTRADRSGLGGLPTRAYRFCDAVTTATGYGWHITSPLNFSLMWDGHEVLWTCDELENEWMPLGLGAVQYPHFRARFDEEVPEDIRGYSPPFLTGLPEAGVVQMWTGLFVRTAPGWSVLTRSPVNLPRPAAYEQFEGIVEFDKWFGPLFTNIRITRTDTPIEINQLRPILQVIPIPQFAYADPILNSATVSDAFTQWGEAEWDAYRESVVIPANAEEHQAGRYAADVRRARRNAGCPFAAMAAAREANEAG
ncbi:DUF6065 family protein [Neoroseomonas oryzicola]|uniref:Uncharacterized protein n=1 Tax=Neoroseomonas oryzicola TaxID=535904 RepID=A0A9X9WM00_9PROT|nr:DUF6065 family protein [Neoroseomonas oryzicola]MBR0661360.1 hypothetical protein [Neoroseomonas oryzicola]NKE17473.1 hypothetical protein [Neoroseomonas oryzicola]